jgi:hypothetical protein
MRCNRKQGNGEQSATRRCCPGVGMGRTVAESVTPAGSGTAGLLLMKSALAAPAGACAAALRSPDEGAPRGLRRSDGSLGVPSSSPPSEPRTGAGAGAGDAEGEGPSGAGRGERSGTTTVMGTFSSRSQRPRGCWNAARHHKKVPGNKECRDGNAMELTALLRTPKKNARDGCGCARREQSAASARRIAPGREPPPIAPPAPAPLVGSCHTTLPGLLSRCPRAMPAAQRTTQGRGVRRALCSEPLALFGGGGLGVRSRPLVESVSP